MTADTGGPNEGLRALDRLRHADENEMIRAMLGAPALSGAERAAASQAARELVVAARASKRKSGMMETFLEEYGLSSPEGLALMCLAEALLRVPDSETADELIAEKIASGDWGDHAGSSDSLMVNASTIGLMLTGRVVRPAEDAEQDAGAFVRRMIREAGEPVIRAASMQAMRIMGRQFVMGRNIKEALERGARQVKKGEAAAQSFDMLGEGARTKADAQRYFRNYADAIQAIGQASVGAASEVSPGVSVKLSALDPMYRADRPVQVQRNLYPMLAELAKLAADAEINLTLDAEEADRLIPSLELLERLAGAPETDGWQGLGLAVQAYQKRAPGVVEWLGDLAQRTGRRLMVRLVKGAYWDTEIKRSQIEGHPDFPVYTTKPATDVSYLTCARKLVEAGSAIYPQFATHNAHTLAAVANMMAAAGREDFEFQRLHGMGESLYAASAHEKRLRVYAPVGAHRDLLPYLVRRLLENGANTSFVHAFLDEDVPPERLAEDPFAMLEAAPMRHPRIAAPPDLFGPSRRNAKGVDLTRAVVRERLEAEAAAQLGAGVIEAGAIVGGKVTGGEAEARLSPVDGHQVGAVRMARDEDVAAAYAAALTFQPEWNARGGIARAEILRGMADAMEREIDRLVVLIAREGGRTLDDGVSEVREAIDFCRYYANDAERDFSGPKDLPGPAGETNTLEMCGRGVFVCISPWNFPLAIFTGQIAAALAAGNCVLAKPAEQTPVVAFEAVKLFHAAGVPADALHLLTGDGKVGAALVEHPACGGVAFTGSTEVAQIIHRTLAAKDGPIVPLIAETGGINAMFVDTTALAEQVVDDVVMSAFRSAGQRCSALRLLYLPHETADRIIEMLEGNVAALTCGAPWRPGVDLGPVIDREAQAMLEAHVEAIGAEAKVRFRMDLGDCAETGSYVAPTIVELSSPEQLQSEVFGPVLHVVRYDPDEVEAVGAELAAKGYGLTLGVHSRLDSFAETVRRVVPAGNVYVNRSIIGAVVGVQPFGGLGLSGTGPKAGGPHYVAGFAGERTVTVNIAAKGGDPGLFNL